MLFLNPAYLVVFLCGLKISALVKGTLFSILVPTASNFLSYNCKSVALCSILVKVK